MARQHKDQPDWEAFDILTQQLGLETAESSAQLALSHAAQRIWEDSITHRILAEAHLSEGRISEAHQCLGLVSGMQRAAITVLEFFRETKGAS